MQQTGLTATLFVGGIAIAIGAMVDAAIVCRRADPKKLDQGSRRPTCRPKRVIIDAVKRSVAQLLLASGDSIPAFSGFSPAGSEGDS